VAKQVHLLATIREHPSLISDPAKLSGMIGVSKSTIRRWIDEEQRKYQESRAANPPDDEE
jgi:DNA-binding MarR family transcriptional regulator